MKYTDNTSEHSASTVLETDAPTVVERNVVIVDENTNTPIICLVCKVKFFNDSESAGSSIEYRCPQCRGCNNGRKGDHIEKISFKEEREQGLIEDSVKVDFVNQVTIAWLPFVCDPKHEYSLNIRNSTKICNLTIGLTK